MKKVSMMVIAFLAMTSTALFGQEYSIKASGIKTIKLMEVNRVEIEGYDGNEIIISRDHKERHDEERAKGLTAISGMGLKDNSGIGLSVVEKEGEIEIQQLAKRVSNKYLIKVPSNVKIHYSHAGSHGSTFKASGIKSEMEVSTKHNSVHLKDVSGPMTINSVHGRIEADFSNVSQSGPSSILSVHGLVDVTLPNSTKANLNLESDYGELYTDMDIEFDLSEGELRSYSSKVIGKLNGGGAAFHVASRHNNVYLRSKK